MKTLEFFLPKSQIHLHGAGAPIEGNHVQSGVSQISTKKRDSKDRLSNDRCLNSGEGRSRWSLFRYLLLFMPIPTAFLLIHLYFFFTVDNHRFGINVDPDYAYLVSAIDLSSLGKSRMVVHPGTTLQLTSHFILKWVYWFYGEEEEDFPTSVLKDPVLYLNVLQHSFAALNMILIFLMGFMAFRLTGEKFQSLIIQSSPAISPQILIFGLRKVTADILLVFVSLMLSLFLMRWLASCKINKTAVYAHLFGLICGFGMATKMVFFPLLVIPFFILPSAVPRIHFIVSTLGWACAFTIPIMPAYPRLLGFLTRIGTHSGIYGQGKEALINLTEYSENFVQLLIKNLPFAGILVISFFLIALTLLKTDKRDSQGTLSKFRLLMAISLAQMFGTMMVARHYKDKYLLPVLCLSGLLAYLSGHQIQELFQNEKRPKKQRFMPSKWLYTFVVAFFAFIIVHTFQGVARFHHERMEKLAEARIIEAKIEDEYHDYGIVYYYNASSVIFGLEFGNRWTPLYAETLKRCYGDQYFYNHFNDQIYNWQGKSKVSIRELRHKFSNKILFFGSPLEELGKSQEDIPFNLEKVLEGQFLSIYKLKTTHGVVH